MATYCIRQFDVPGSDLLPSSVPLVIPDNARYDRMRNEVRLQPGERNKLALCQTTIELLTSIKKPIAVLAICGPYRTGKSYILSKMLGAPDIFKLGHTFNAQTLGIWLGTSYLDFGDHAMVCLDTEGINAPVANGSEDIRILVLAVLISSFLIYNSMRVPDKTDLEKMSCFSQLATNIKIYENKAENSGSDAEYQQHFPDFLWLLRDVTLQPADKSGKLVTPVEYLFNEVLDDTNETARALKGCFHSLDCLTLPPPTVDEEVLQHIELHEDKLSQKFVSRVSDLVKSLREKVHIKRGFGSAEGIDGPTLALLITKYLEAVNDPNAVPCLDSTWETVTSIRLKAIMNQLLMSYESDMDKEIMNYLPMEEMTTGNSGERALMHIHQTTLKAKVTALLDAAKYLSPKLDVDSRTTWEKELQEQFTSQIVMEEVDKTTGTNHIVSGILHNYLKCNYDKSLEYCVAKFNSLYQQIRERIDFELSSHEKDGIKRQLPPTYTYNNYQDDKKTLEKDYFAAAIGPAKQEVWRKKIEDTKHDEWLIAKLPKFEHRIVDLTSQLSTTEIELQKLTENVKSLERERDSLKNEWVSLQERFTELSEQKAQQTENQIKQRHQIIREAFQGRRIITRNIYLCGLYRRETEAVEELGDDDARQIGQIWFNHHYPALNVTPDFIRTECEKLNIALPNGRNEDVESLLVHAGRQLYSQNFIELEKPHNLQPDDVVIVQHVNQTTVGTAF